MPRPDLSVAARLPDFEDWLLGPGFLGNFGGQKRKPKRKEIAESFGVFIFPKLTMFYRNTFFLICRTIEKPFFCFLFWWLFGTKSCRARCLSDRLMPCCRGFCAGLREENVTWSGLASRMPKRWAGKGVKVLVCFYVLDIFFGKKIYCIRYLFDFI